MAAREIDAARVADRCDRRWVLLRVLEEHGLLVTVCAVMALFWALEAPYLMLGDSWLTLLGGRELVRHGFMHGDQWAVLTQGQAWVDQQWLAQLAFWGLTRLGGIRLDLLAAVVLLLVPYALAVALACRRGASPISIAPFAILPGVAFSQFLRAQLFSQLLIVPLIALLSAESRRPSRRVYLVFPLLVLWANLHGVALLGAALVALLGLAKLAEARRPSARAALLLVAPWPCLLVTPYGIATVGYYRSLLGSSVLRQTSAEWMAPTFLSLNGLPLFVLAAIAIALVVRRPRDLTLFELGALALTLLGGLYAIRSIPWFGYACLILLPPLLEQLRSPRLTPDDGLVRARVALAAASSLIALGALAVIAVESTATLTRTWPDGAATAVSRVLRQDPDARVLATHKYADWLLYQSPETRGRIAFDGRWELISPAQARPIFAYLWHAGRDWEQLSRGYRLIVLDPKTETELVKTYDSRPGTRVLFRNRRFVVYDRSAAADARSHKRGERPSSAPHIRRGPGSGPPALPSLR
jgi:hypothetical protein